MNHVSGWKDKIIDKGNDLAVILATNGDDLTVYKSKYNDLPNYKFELKEYFEKRGKELEYKTSDESRRIDWSEEFDEVIFALLGKPLEFTEAVTLFPYLVEKSFWEKESWKTYKGKPYTQLIK